MLIKNTHIYIYICPAVRSIRIMYLNKSLITRSGIAIGEATLTVGKEDGEVRLISLNIRVRGEKRILF